MPWATPQPLMLALPGNHDWYDGLTSFLRLFTQGRMIGGWRTEQKRSYFTVQLPHRWWLYAVDIQQGMLDLLQTRVAKEKLTNVVPVLGAVDDPRLPDESVDLVIMVDVYHELSSPQTTLAHVRRALKPGGRLVLLEYRAEDPDVPILPEHKMTKAQVKLEVEHEGFQQQRVFDDLPRQHLIVFTRP